MSLELVQLSIRQFGRFVLTGMGNSEFLDVPHVLQCLLCHPSTLRMIPPPFGTTSTLSVRRAEAPGSLEHHGSRVPSSLASLDFCFTSSPLDGTSPDVVGRFIPRRKERHPVRWCTQRVAVESAVVRKKGGSESRRLLEDPDSTENRRDPPARRLVLVEHTMLMLKEGSQEMRTH